MPELSTLKTAIKTEALRLGFSHFGVASTLPEAHYSRFRAWIGEGLHADMQYLGRADTLAKRGDPDLILEGCQSLICLALPYTRPEAPLDERYPGQGRVSSYARTQDYHTILWDRLAQLESFIRQNTDGEVLLKSYVDTGPVLERSYATQAGIGIAGKNTCLIIRKAGSFFFLAEILTDLPLPVDTPITRDICGSCTRCIDACPAGCIRPDRTIDATRCISALTIEQRGIIPDEKKKSLGEWVFGCDACQIVCPHNSRPSEPYMSLGTLLVPEFLDLMELFTLDQTEFNTRFNLSPISRTKRAGLLRNAAIVLGNQAFQPALPVLQKCLLDETEPGLLDACQWAIREIENSSIQTTGEGENQ